MIMMRRIGAATARSLQTTPMMARRMSRTTMVVSPAQQPKRYARPSRTPHHQRNTRIFSSNNNSSSETDSPQSQASILSSHHPTKQPRRKLPDQLALLEKQQKGGSPHLTAPEQALLNALRQHRETPDNPKSTAELRQCYENLKYWEYALQTELEWEQQHLIPATLVASSSASSSSSNDLELEQADSWYRQGVYWRRLEQLSVATKLYQRALDVYAKIYPDGLHRQKGQILISLAGIHYHRQNWSAALKLLRQAEPHCTATVDDDDNDDDTSMLAECLQHQGLLHQSMEDYELALEKNQRALELLMPQQQQQQQRIDDSSSSTDDATTMNQQQQQQQQEQRLLPLQLTIADLYASMNQLEQARTSYEALLERYCGADDDDDDDNSKDEQFHQRQEYCFGRRLALQTGQGLRPTTRAAARPNRLVPSGTRRGDSARGRAGQQRHSPRARAVAQRAGRRARRVGPQGAGPAVLPGVPAVGAGSGQRRCRCISNIISDR